MDFTCPKDVQKQTASGALGEIWDYCVDAGACLFGGYGLKTFSQNRVQWIAGVGQYIKADLLDKAEKSTTTEGNVTTTTWTPAIFKVYGDKDHIFLSTVSGSDA